MLDRLRRGENIEHVHFFSARSSWKVSNELLLSTQISMKHLKSVKFHDIEITVKSVKALTYLKCLRYVRVMQEGKQKESTFIAVYFFMLNKISEKVNLMFTDLFEKSLKLFSREEQEVKVVYLLSLAARNVWNTFYTSMDNTIRKKYFHMFLTTLENMNRELLIRRGVFLGGIGLGYSLENFNSYIQIYPPAGQMKHPYSNEIDYLASPFPTE